MPTMALSNLVINSRSKMEKICAVTDPFCEHAKGMRWIDGASFGTVPYRVRNHLAIATSATGSALVEFNPQYLAACQLTFAWAGSNYTAGSNYGSVTGSTNLAATFTQFRVVTAGIIIRNLSSVMLTSGYLIISRSSTPTLLAATGIPAGQVNFTSVLTVPVTPAMEIPVIHMPLGTQARDFIGFLPTATTQWTDQCWDTIRIELVGGNQNAVVLDIEVIYNYEFTLPDGSILSQGLPAKIDFSAKDIEIATRTANSLGDRVWNSVKEVGKFVADAAKEAGIAVAVSRFGGAGAGPTMAGRVSGRSMRAIEVD